MTLVTVAASYGAGGSRVAPELARGWACRSSAGPPITRRAPAPETDAANAGVGAGGCSRGARQWPSRGARPPGLTADQLLPDEPRRRELEREVRAFAPNRAAG